MQMIRTASMNDLDAITEVEAECFPAAEAATREEFSGRLRHYADHFWLLFEDGKLVSFVDGMVTSQPDLTDEMYADASLHDPAGEWQMIFGVNTLPEFRRRGRKGAGSEGPCADLQRPAGALLCILRFCQRRRVRLHPRRSGVVPDAVDILTEKRLQLFAAGAFR